LEKHPAAIDI